MPTLNPSPFCTWELSERESIEGQILSFNQRCVIQNHIATAAKEKIELTYTHKEATQYWQREAELQGTILTLQHLLQCSEAAVLELEAYLQATGNARELSDITGTSSSPFDGANFGNTPDTPPVVD